MPATKSMWQYVCPREREIDAERESLPDLCLFVCVRPSIWKDAHDCRHAKMPKTVDLQRCPWLSTCKDAHYCLTAKMPMPLSLFLSLSLSLSLSQCCCGFVCVWCMVIVCFCFYCFFIIVACCIVQVKMCNSRTPPPHPPSPLTHTTHIH